MPIWVRQAAVIPIRENRLCLVTSSSGRRWVVPKGQIDPGHTAGEAALVEAWEEAGLVGALDPEPIGTYAYEKLGRELLVVVFRMIVTEVRDEWPEQQGLRTREVGHAGRCPRSHRRTGPPRPAPDRISPQKPRAADPRHRLTHMRRFSK